MSYYYKLSQHHTQLVKNCIATLNSLSVPFSDSIFFKYNGGHTKYGSCRAQRYKKTTPCDYIITINKYMVSDDDFVCTVYHELLHSIKGCDNHGPAWKNYAGIVSESLGVSITRTSTHQLMPQAYNTARVPRRSATKPKPDLFVICPLCGEKSPALARHLHKDGTTDYYCKNCKRPMFSVLPVCELSALAPSARHLLVQQKIADGAVFDDTLYTYLCFLQDDDVNNLVLYVLQTHVWTEKLLAQVKYYMLTSSTKKQICRNYVSGAYNSKVTTKQLALALEKLLFRTADFKKAQAYTTKLFD